jgi:hypothetical protein
VVLHFINANLLAVEDASSKSSSSLGGLEHLERDTGDAYGRVQRMSADNKGGPRQPEVLLANHQSSWEFTAGCAQNAAGCSTLYGQPARPPGAAV